MATDDAGYDDVLSGGADGALLPGGAQPPGQAAAPKRTLGRSVGVGALAIALFAGGAVFVSARSSDVNSDGPQSVLPGSAFAFAMVDLEPADEQANALGEFVKRFPSAKSASADELRERAVSAITGQLDLDYDTDVEPWLGRRAGIAGFPAAAGKPTMVIALEVKDAAAATATLAAMDDPPSYAERGNYVLIAPDKASLTAAFAASDDVTLSDDAQFAEDVARLEGPQIAIAWADNTASADAMLYDLEHPEPGQEFGVDPYIRRIRAGAVGRTVLGVRAHGTYAEILGYTVGRGTVATGALTDVLSLPDTTIGAAFVASPDALLTGKGGGLFASLGIAGHVPPLSYGASAFLYGFGYGFGGDDSVEVAPSSATMTASAMPTAAATTAPADPVSAMPAPTVLPDVPAVQPSLSAMACAVPSPATDEKPAACEAYSTGTEEFTPLDPYADMTAANPFAGAFASATLSFGSLPIPGSKAAPDLSLVAKVADPALVEKSVAAARKMFAESFSGSTPFSAVDGGVLTLASSSDYAARLRSGALGKTELFRQTMGPLGGEVEYAVFANLERVRDIVPGYPKELLPVSAIGISSSRDGDVSVTRIRLVSR